MDCVTDGAKFILYNNYFSQRITFLSVIFITLLLYFILLSIRRVKNIKACHFYITKQKVEKARKNLKLTIFNMNVAYFYTNQ